MECKLCLITEEGERGMEVCEEAVRVLETRNGCDGPVKYAPGRSCSHFVEAKLNNESRV